MVKKSCVFKVHRNVSFSERDTNLSSDWYILVQFFLLVIGGIDKGCSLSSQHARRWEETLTCKGGADDASVRGGRGKSIMPFFPFCVMSGTYHVHSSLLLQGMRKSKGHQLGKTGRRPRKQGCQIFYRTKYHV